MALEANLRVVAQIGGLRLLVRNRRVANVLRAIPLPNAVAINSLRECAKELEFNANSFSALGDVEAQSRAISNRKRATHRGNVQRKNEDDGEGEEPGDKHRHRNDGRLPRISISGARHMCV